MQKYKKSITVEDKETKAKKQITVLVKDATSTEPLELQEKESETITLMSSKIPVESEQKELHIIKGAGSYKVQSGDNNIATVVLDGDVVRITAVMVDEKKIWFKYYNN